MPDNLTLRGLDARLQRLERAIGMQTSALIAVYGALITLYGLTEGNGPEVKQLSARIHEISKQLDLVLNEPENLA